MRIEQYWQTGWAYIEWQLNQPLTSWGYVGSLQAGLAVITKSAKGSSPFIYAPFLSLLDIIMTSWEGLGVMQCDICVNKCFLHCNESRCPHGLYTCTNYN